MRLDTRPVCFSRLCRNSVLDDNSKESQLTPGSDRRHAVAEEGCLVSGVFLTLSMQ